MKRNNGKWAKASCFELSSWSFFSKHSWFRIATVSKKFIFGEVYNNRYQKEENNSNKIASYCRHLDRDKIARNDIIMISN
jgi:hypothetical protein